MLSYAEHVNRKHRFKCVGRQVSLSERRGSQNPSEWQQNETQKQNDERARSVVCSHLSQSEQMTPQQSLCSGKTDAKSALINENLPKWMSAVAFSVTAEILNAQQEKAR